MTGACCQLPSHEGRYLRGVGMSIFRCDFAVESDMILLDDAAATQTRLSSGHELFIRNAAPDIAGNVAGLVCSVIGDAPDIENVHQLLRDELAEFLDLLAFVTQSRFEITKVDRVFDWEAGQGSRRMKLFETFPGLYPPDRDLTDEYLATVTSIEQGTIDGFVRVALKYFRLGFMEASAGDQFLRYWLALEIIAENRKVREKAPIKCTACGGAIKCAHCGDEPQRRPMATDAIREIIKQITGKSSVVIIKRQFAARNGITHGRDVAAIERESGQPLDQILNELVRIVWHAIIAEIPKPPAGSRLAFGERDEFATKTLTISMIGGFEHNGDGDHPPENALPNARIKVLGPDQRTGGE